MVADDRRLGVQQPQQLDAGLINSAGRRREIERQPVRVGTIGDDAGPKVVAEE
jgi:hypothetical protein